jgi:RNA polymerase sigma factor (sigma-70 family)
MDENEPSATGPVGPGLLGRVFDQHAAALEFYARQWCDSPEDVVQEALLLLAAEPRAPRDVAAWLYHVVRARAINASRSAKRRKCHENAAAQLETGWIAPSPGDAIDAHAAAEALAGLPEGEREVVVAHVWGGLTFQQIAELMDTSDSTAHRRYASALAALRQKLRIPCPKNP